jgi:hypothetical protein
MTYCSFELPNYKSGSHNHLLMLTRWWMGEGTGSDLITSCIAVEATVRVRSFEIDQFSAQVRQGSGRGAGACIRAGFGAQA